MGKKEKEELKTHVQNDQTKKPTPVEEIKIIEEPKSLKSSKILAKKSSTPTTTPPPPFNFSITKIIGIIAIASISFFIFILLLPTPYYKTGFRNISELQEYAKTIDEWIEMENDNFEFPNYDKYYNRKFLRTFWRQWKEKFVWFLTKLCLKKEPIFSSSFFKELLEDVTAYRLSQEWQGDFVQKIEINQNTKIVVFGVVQGAYHSLIRNIKQLEKLNIINEHLKLKNPNFFIVFLGNVIDRSPYTLETLSVVLRLLQENPNNIIYLRGTHESNGYWKSHTLKQELKIRCHHMFFNWSYDDIPFSKKIETFFNSLPITLYCASTSILNKKKINYFKIFNQELFQKLNESNYVEFLTKTNRQLLETFFPKDPSNDLFQKDISVTLKAIIRAIRKREGFEIMDGLKPIAPIKGIPAWTIFSCPSADYARKCFNFYYDAFTIIDNKIDNNLNDFIITLYSRDSRNKKFKNFNKKTFNLFSSNEIIM
jgi:hypothetical protein